MQPSAKREGFATVPDTTWADVGALQHVREELSMAILVGGSHTHSLTHIIHVQSHTDCYECPVTHGLLSMSSYAQTGMNV